MAEVLTSWLWGNKIELLGALLGVLYIFFSIRQHILTWPTGLFTSLLYIIVFFRSGFYADMGLQVYYVGVSIYGWYYWIKGGQPVTEKAVTKVPITRIPLRLLAWAGLATIAIFVLLVFILMRFTDSTVPLMDAFTTALSILATWMLARKYIEHWMIWIVVDLVSTGLYVYKSLWPTVVLFIVYTVMAVAGHREWKKDMEKKC
ncbi:MAG: nicotinamide riboside transporter PnuC [Mariniphaga sp.]|nr:nicotinamide riboside transporter PnuC [Mariniphaga sp.]